MKERECSHYPRLSIMNTVSVPTELGPDPSQRNEGAGGYCVATPGHLLGGARIRAARVAAHPLGSGRRIRPRPANAFTQGHRALRASGARQAHVDSAEAPGLK